MAASALPLRALAGASRSVDFQVWRNGLQIGEHSVRVGSAGGDTVADIEAHFVVSIGPIPVFRYRHTARETWRDGRFAAFEAQTVSNGRRQSVHAARTASAVSIQVGDRPAVDVDAETMPLSHWNVKALSGPMFNPQTGKLLAKERVQPLGPRPVELASGRVVDARAFALSGDAQITDWYDAADTWTGLRAKVMDGSFVDYRRV